MLPKLQKKELTLRKVSPTLTRPRSSSNKPSENQPTGKRSRNVSPILPNNKALLLQKMFRKADIDEENYFIQLVQELN